LVPTKRTVLPAEHRSVRTGWLRGTTFFVGTKRQAQEAVAEEAKRCGAFFVNHRWLGGTLTNWSTLQKSIKRLKLLKAMTEDGRMLELSKKERARLDREMKHCFRTWKASRH